MDVARVAKRLGAEEALIIYRSDRAHMAAHEFEAAEAIEEGVKINWLRTIKAIDETTFTVEVMEVDENGHPRGTGRTETLEADALVLAVGQNTDVTLLKDVPGITFQKDSTVIVDDQMMTGHRYSRGRHIPGTHGHRGRRPWQEGGPASMPGCATTLRQTRRHELRQTACGTDAAQRPQETST
jgi:hypothetical protein